MATKNMKEVKESAEQLKREEFAKQVSSALQLLDLTNIPNKSYTVYNKESLRTYLKNPLSDSNAKNLRKLSQYLYVLSPQYREIIEFYATQIDASLYSIIPNISISEDNDEQSILQNYESVAKWMEKMNVPAWLYSALVTAWREDVFYGYIFYDDSAEQDVNSFLVLPLDPDYCRISSVNYDGSLNFAYDFSYFDNNTNKIYLEVWGKEWNKMYDAYQADTRNMRWQELDPNLSVCFKVNYDQTDRVIPSFASLFENIIDLIDLQGITAVKDQLSIYKLLVAEIGYLNNGETNDFEIDLDLAVNFFNKMNSVLPDQIGAILSPMKVTPINFEQSDTDDVNRISKANKNLFESAGVSPFLSSEKISGTTAVTAALRFKSLVAVKPLLAQLEARVNRFLDFVLPNNGMRIRYMPVTPYFKDEAIKQVKDACTLGLPMKTQYATLIGLSPLDMYSMSYLENDVMKLHEKFIPMQSSYTQTGASDTGGAPTKDLTDLTDDGESSIDKRDAAG